ncbi:MAG: NAD(P)H-binding protein, partial [Bacillus sp. (in: Bacteria)]|nr:NAD(P)H-binding protein [Bacillus sp. (in: firmicutes)]
MKTILVTGFTGNVGFEVAQKLIEKKATIRCAVRNIEKAKAKFGEQYEYVKFDLNKPETFESSLEGIGGIFLLFPPEAKVPGAMKAFLKRAKEKGVSHITYLSVK